MADLVVHRQLSAALGDDKGKIYQFIFGYKMKFIPDVTESEYETQNLDKQAKRCNEMKFEAKLAGEEGSMVYLWSFVKVHFVEIESQINCFQVSISRHRTNHGGSYC